MCQVQTLQLAAMKRANGKSHTTNHDLSKRANPLNTTLEYNLSNAFCEGTATRKRKGYKNPFVCSRLYCYTIVILRAGLILSSDDPYKHLVMSEHVTGKGLTDVNPAKMHNAEQPTTKQQSNQSIKPIKPSNQWNILKPPNQSRKCQTNQGDIMKHNQTN